ncbi:class A beta-lactamase [Paenibacillus wulumuqiensis]|uniref:class A beta-lactamase n=1 Tax=Paenibacillus wulumuqiensis TaxID=1567107 RepID=UPI000AFE020D|nr:class A beta-lactamase [Paenibacillus wulumuqiensis]
MKKVHLHKYSSRAALAMAALTLLTLTSSTLPAASQAEAAAVPPAGHMAMTAASSINHTAAPAPAKHSNASVVTSLKHLEQQHKGRVGVYAVDTGTGRVVAYRHNERFAFASTYKALAAAAVLQQSSISDLDRVITYSADDLVEYSPITEKHVETGMTLREICLAAIQYSDNTAGNILFQELNGPAGFQQALRQIGDTVTRSERIEPELNEIVPGDSRDTSTPRALARDLRLITTTGKVLTQDKRQLLTEWMKGNTTGDQLIRAAVPKGWVVGDKTGSAAYGTRNDIAIIWPPDRAPIIMAILTDHDDKDAKTDNELVAKAARITLKALK